LIARLAKLPLEHPRRVLAAAVLVFAVAAVLGGPVTGVLTSTPHDYQSPSSQYERTNRAIEAATGQSAYYDVVLLVRGRGDLQGDAAASRAIGTLVELLAAHRGFQRALDYPRTHAPTLLSRDRHETLVLAAFASEDNATGAVARVRAELSRPAAPTRLAGLTVRFGGYAVTNQELNERTTSELARAELLALPLLLALSFWFFRGVIAALLPLLVGGLSIIVTFLALRAIDQFTPISVFALNLVSGMGLGLGIDYSLFIVYRYREELAAGVDSRLALERTLRTVGRTVLFSCLTVAAALTSLLVFPLRFLSSMGIGGTIVVLCDGAVALLALPALLVVLGPRINALSPAWLQLRAASSARVATEGGWWRLAHGVVRRPAAVALISAAALLVAAVPALHVRFGSTNADLLPSSAESHQVEAALVHRFAANVEEATEIVVRGSRSEALRLAGAAAEVAGAPRAAATGAPAPATGTHSGASALASIAPPMYLGRGSWRITLLPHGSPSSEPQLRLLARLRTIARPYGALVGGSSAFLVDQRAAIADRIPLALLILMPLTAVFLFLMTGSVTIPIKALVMNLLSVSVGAGLIVLIFQDGHLSGLLGFTPIGGLEESTLVLMLIVAFALATDYEVFVLARIKEAHDQGLPNREAIAVGIERTGRIITAAALLFCVAIGALVSSDLFFTKQLGVGAALTVAIDASVVRALLVPSLMALMGDWNWWAPAPLRRLHDRFGLHESGQRPVLATLVLAEGGGPSTTSSPQPERDRSNT
jgi:putative drug exporter of the RND superfamily